MSDFIQSRRERFLTALTSQQGTEHQNSFRLDPETVRGIIDGYASDPAESSETIQDGQSSAYLNAIFHNPLDDYLLPRYHIQLSIVNIDGDPAAQARAAEGGPEPQASELRRDAPDQSADVSTIAADLTYQGLYNKPFTIVAFTGHVKTGEHGTVAPADKLPTLLGVSQFTLKNYNSPSQQNPHIATYAEANMTLLEPYTFSFDRILNDLASDHGYSNMPASRVIFRVDIWFSGWVEDGTYEENIPITNPFNRQGGETTSETFTTFMNLIRVNAKINLSNSEVGLNFVPVQFISLGAASEYLAIPGQHIPLSEEGQTLENALKAFEDTLNESAGVWRIMGVDATGQPDESTAFDIHKYQYKIECADQALMNSSIFPDRTPDDDLVQAVYTGDSIIDVIMNLVRSTRRARDGLAPDRYPRLLYTVRVVTDLGERGESVGQSFLGDQVRINIKLLIEPYYDFRFVPPNRAQALDDKGVRLAALISAMAIRRVYWFDHFGLNTEVIRFDQDLNNFYFKNIIDVDFNVSIGEYRSNESNEEMTSPPVPAPRAELGSLGGLSANDTSRVAEALNIRRRPSINSLRRGRSAALGATPPDRLNGADGNTTTGNRAAALYENEFNNLVQTDLIQLDNMEVRGDPRWLFTASNRQWTSVEQEQQPLPEGDARSDVIMVNVMSPKAQQYMAREGLTTALAAEENRAYDLTGFYQIVSVEHTFSGGLYTQKFAGTRLIIDPVDASVAAQEREGLAEDAVEFEEEVEQQREERNRSARSNATGENGTDGPFMHPVAPGGFRIPRG